ncbi:MAG: hypothetical protein WA715_28245 [Candidatus Acidiferrum sp.]
MVPDRGYKPIATRDGEGADVYPPSDSPIENFEDDPDGRKKQLKYKFEAQLEI